MRSSVIGTSPRRDKKVQEKINEKTETGQIEIPRPTLECSVVCNLALQTSKVNIFIPSTFGINIGKKSAAPGQL